MGDASGISHEEAASALGEAEKELKHLQLLQGPAKYFWKRGEKEMIVLQTYEHSRDFKLVIHTANDRLKMGRGTLKPGKKEGEVTGSAKRRGCEAAFIISKDKLSVEVAIVGAKCEKRGLSGAGGEYSSNPQLSAAVSRSADSTKIAAAP